MRGSPAPAILAAVTLLALVAPVARATTVGLEITGGYGAFDYGAVNDQLTMLNDQTGSEFGAIHGGGGVGFGLRAWPTDRWMLRFSTEMASTATTSSSVGEMSFDPMPSFFTFDITYFFVNSKPFLIGLGAGGGMADLSGEYKVPGPGGLYNITGDGPEGHGLFEADIGLTKRAAILLLGGYRYARVPDTQFDDVSSDPVLETDLTGPYFRVGFTYDWR